VTAAANRPSSELILELAVAPQFEDDVDVDLIENVLGRALAAMTVSGPVTLSLVITDDRELQELNLKYRGIDAPTDVLSFSQREGASGHEKVDFPAPESAPLALGDVIISGERVRSQADEYGHTRRRELAYLAVHGLLHVLGHDHETVEEGRVMREAEEAALEEVPRKQRAERL